METNYINQPSVNLETLIGGLKKEDARNLKMVNQMQQLMWGIAAAYVFIFALKFIFDTPWYEKLGGFLITIAFVVFALIFRNYYKEYKSIDYGISTIEMLRKAVCRYKLFQRRSLYVLAPLILEGIGLNLMMNDKLSALEPMQRILYFQLAYLLVMLMALLVGYFIWKKRQKPLYDHALALLKEFES